MIIPRLSVVVPAYNAESFIRECLDSVLAQEGCVSFEIIVIDDGSNDKTYEIIENGYPMVRLFKKENGGPGAARNFGVAKAGSEIIVFLDSDDVMLPGRLALQGDFMLNNPRYGLTFGNQRYQLKPDYDANKDRGLKLSGDFSEVENAYSKLIVNGNFVANTTCAVRKEAYLKVGGQPVNYFVGEDYKMHLRLARNWPVAATGRYLAWYRQGNEGKLMASSHTYRGPVMVLREELLDFRTLLSSDDYHRAFERWSKGANMLLRWVWIETGNKAVIAEIEKLRPLLPRWLYVKWVYLSFLPPSLGRWVRQARRLFGETCRQMRGAV